MRLFVKFLREPLVHFVIIGAAVFALYTLTDRTEPEPRDRIIITDGRVRQLVEVFARTWQRPPTAQDLRGLIDDHIKEEVYYREALKLGLDRDDAVIRRRMRQKMEFLIEPSEAELEATDAELEAFLAANRSRFRTEPQIAFQQVFINPNRVEQPAAVRAASTLSSLRSASPSDDTHRYGDATLLPYDMPLSSLSAISRTFGEDFVTGLLSLPEGTWSGPVTSPFGLHLIHIAERRGGYDPALEEIRKAVELEWQTQKRETFAQNEYQRLLDKYEVILPFEDTQGEAAKLLDTR